jgi:hypothetical protein
MRTAVAILLTLAAASACGQSNEPTAVAQRGLADHWRRALGPMVVAEVRCGGENCRHDIAVVVFRPAKVEAGT